LSTSGVYTYSTSQGGIIQAALRKINVAGDFETVATTDSRYIAAQNAINPLIKQYMAFGMPVWAVTELTIPFSTTGLNSTAGCTIGLTGQTVTSVAPLKVIQGLRVDNLSNITVPLNIYTYEDYEILSNKAATGAPVHVFYQPLRNSGIIKVWPLPDPTYWQVNGSLYIRYQRPYQDFTADTDEPDFPIEWNKVLIYGLAYDLAPEYGIDPMVRQTLKADRDDALNTLLMWGTEEGSFFMTPRQTPGHW